MGINSPITRSRVIEDPESGRLVRVENVNFNTQNNAPAEWRTTTKSASFARGAEVNPETNQAVKSPEEQLAERLGVDSSTFQNVRGLLGDTQTRGLATSLTPRRGSVSERLKQASAEYRGLVDANEAKATSLKSKPKPFTPSKVSYSYEKPEVSDVNTSDFENIA